jgi:hypothetical protein
MVCSVCKGSGHNKRTCIAQKIDDSGIPDDLKEEAINHITKNVTDAALLEAMELGLDIIIPGVGMTMKMSRLGWQFITK